MGKVTSQSVPSDVISAAQKNLKKSDGALAYCDFSNKLNDQKVNLLDSGLTAKNFGNASMFVQNGLLVHTPYAGGNNSAGYLQSKLTSKLTRIGGEFIIPVGASSAEFVLVAPLIDWSGMNFNDAGVHAWSTKTGWVYGIRQGGTDIYLARGTYANPLVDDGVTKYKFEISLNHRTNTATVYLPDGTITIVSDPRITSLSSTYALWELFEYNANPATPTTPFKIATIWASHNDDDIGNNRNVVSRAELENATGNVLKTVPQMLSPKVMVYQPATQADWTAPTSLDFVDQTNAKISITPPLSGKILVEVTGHIVNTVAGSSYLMTVDTGGNGTGGNAQQICKGVYDANFEAKWLLTGVTQQPLPIDIKLKHFATTSGPVLKAGSGSGYFLVIKVTPLP